MAQVRAENVSKSFGAVTALDNVSLAFEDGRLTVMVGPSGCGKTTLLRIIAGLEEPTAGQIYVAGKRIDDVPAWERNTAMVFQSYALYPHMKVYDNMAFPLRAHKTPKEEIRPRVEQAAQALGLSDLLQRKPRELSGGQMQRVALGRAIVRQPDVFLMDEPLSNLDAKLRVEMRAELKRLQKDLAVTTIYVTHDQAEAMTMADTLVVMRDGHVQQLGDPEEVYLQPTNMFVASFIGSPAMNFVRCRYDAASRTLNAESFARPVPEWYAGPLQQLSSDEVMLGIRPENLRIQRPPCEEGVCATVYIAEPMGRETLLTLEVGSTLVKAMAPPEIRCTIGEAVWMTFDDRAVRLFAAGTQNRIPPSEGFYAQ